MTECPECGRPVFDYSPGIVTCKVGHRWKVPESLAAVEPVAFTPTRVDRHIPAWIPGTVLGLVALLIEAVEVIF